MSITGKKQLLAFRSLPLQPSLTTSLTITGLTLQMVGLLCDSWIFVERFVTPHCRSQLKMNMFSYPNCNMTYFKKEEISRAGLWRVCYLFPHLDNIEHTDPYCADFADDEYPAKWLVTIQSFCLLSASLAVLALVLVGFTAWTGIQRMNMAWISSRLLVIAGFVGILGTVHFHWNMRKEFLVYYHPSYMTAYKWWGFHFFLDGCILIVGAGLLWDCHEKIRKFTRRLYAH